MRQIALSWSFLVLASLAVAVRAEELSIFSSCPSSRDPWVCDPQGVLHDAAIDARIAEFEKSSLPCNGNQSVWVHPHMGVVVVNYDAVHNIENAPQEWLEDLHRHWNLDIRSNDTTCDDTGILFLVVVSDDRVPHLFTSVGNLIRQRLGAWRVQKIQATLQRDTMIACRHQMSCYNVVLDRGIRLWTSVLQSNSLDAVSEARASSIYLCFVCMRMALVFMLYGSYRCYYRWRPVTLYSTSSKHLYKSDACPVCLEPFVVDEETTPLLQPVSVQQFVCGHSVCQACWQSLVQQHRTKIYCPLCRQAVATRC